MAAIIQQTPLAGFAKPSSRSGSGPVTELVPVFIYSFILFYTSTVVDVLHLLSFR